MQSFKTRTILGIDPGTKRIGFGAVKKDGKEYSLIEAGLLRSKKGEGVSDLSAEFLKKLRKYQPDLVVIEKIYFGKNWVNVLSVSEVKGAFISQAGNLGVKIIEISPSEVKSIVCGYGLADKTSVRKMVLRTIQAGEEIKSKDAIDALAIAIAGEVKFSASEKIAARLTKI
jgi:crossover junction endodeoxyribonuclease RuvC